MGNYHKKVKARQQRHCKYQKDIINLRGKTHAQIQRTNEQATFPQLTGGGSRGLERPEEDEEESRKGRGGHRRKKKGGTKRS